MIYPAGDDIPRTTALAEGNDPYEVPQGEILIHILAELERLNTRLEWIQSNLSALDPVYDSPNE